MNNGCRRDARGRWHVRNGRGATTRAELSKLLRRKCRQGQRRGPRGLQAPEQGPGPRNARGFWLLALFAAPSVPHALLLFRLPSASEQERPQSPPASGHAKITYPNGDIYEGNYEGGMRHGKGIMKFADGRQYRGKWRLDMVSVPLPCLACPDLPAGRSRAGSDCARS